MHIQPGILARIFALAFAIVASLAPASASAQTITTIAGNGQPGSAGDGGPALAASLTRPTDVIRAPNGDLIIADNYGQRVRRVATDGTITTVAGNGTYGYSGDGGPATEAQFAYPQQVALDADGNIYVADANNSRIRKIDTAGIITTIAGNGVAAYAPDGPALGHPLLYPSAVAVRNGEVYFSEFFWAPFIRKIDLAGNIVTIAGTGASGSDGDGGPALQATFGQVLGLAFDQAGNLYAADYVANRVRRIATDGTITTVAGGNESASPATDEIPGNQARLDGAFDVTVDLLGNVYIGGNTRVRRVDANGIIHAFAGPASGQTGFAGDGGDATAALLDWPSGVGVDDAGNVFIADTFNMRIRQVTPAELPADCAATGITGNKLVLCRRICEGNETPSTQLGLIKAYLAQFGEPPYCAR